VPAALPTPGRLHAIAGDPSLAGDPWLDEPPGPPPADDASGWPAWPDDDPGPDDPEDVITWLDAELAKATPWLDGADWDDPEPPSPAAAAEVFKAGRWDRTRGTGGGFAAGGAADHLPPGPILAGLAADRWADGLDRLSDDELIGVLRAARRLTSWATAMELAAVGDLWRRRTADQDAGDTGAAANADAELAAALTLTRHAADRLLNLAAALDRLPATRQALAVGDLDPPRAKVIAEEVTGLTGQHAAAVEAAIIGAAPGLTTGQLRAAARRAVLTADPTAARRRKEQALRQARVERWSEPAGTAALAGRDLPPVAVLAADANLTALAKQLKAAGAEGTLDALRAQIYLALLSGTPPAALLPANTGTDHPGDTNLRSDTDRPSDINLRSDTDQPRDSGWPGLGGNIAGRVNLTVPLATWLGCSNAPGHVPGYGPLDATDSRTLADALATQAGTRWCLTFTGPDGQPLVHGCARTGPPPGRRRTQPATRPRAGPQPGSRDRPQTGASRGQWTFTVTALTGGCDHALETPAYQPPAALRHLVNIRHATCVFPGCRRPAPQCDADHTIPYNDGGKTCLCNLAPLCRRHHQVKQTPGWTLTQTGPGNLTWTTPSGRRYTSHSG